MGSRTDWLTEFAKPFADELAERMGSQKRILSAAVMAFYEMNPEQREYYMAKAVGKEMPDKDSINQAINLWTNLDCEVRSQLGSDLSEKEIEEIYALFSRNLRKALRSASRRNKTPK